MEEIKLHIKICLEKYGHKPDCCYEYGEIKSAQEMSYIYQLKFNKILNETDSAIINNYYGLYFYYKKNYKKMIKYYANAIEHGYSAAMNNLGYYYQTIDNIDQMMKYYRMAIKLNNTTAMNNLGYYYYLKNDINKMIKYYALAIKLNNSNTIHNMGHYCYSIGNIDQMIKYYTMAANLRNDKSIYNLACYYGTINNTKKMTEYLSIAASYGNIYALIHLSIYYKKNKNYAYMKSCMLLSIDLNMDNKLINFLINHCHKWLDYELLIILIDKYPFVHQINIFVDCVVSFINKGKYDQKIFSILTQIYDHHYNSKISQSFDTFVKTIEQDVNIQNTYVKFLSENNSININKRLNRNWWLL